MAKPGAIQVFKTLTQQVSTWVPKNLFSEVVLKIDKLQNTISLQRPTEINQLGIALVFLFIFGFSAGNSLAERTVVSFGVFDTGDDTGFG